MAAMGQASREAGAGRALRGRPPTSGTSGRCAPDRMDYLMKDRPRQPLRGRSNLPRVRRPRGFACGRGRRSAQKAHASTFGLPPTGRLDRYRQRRLPIRTECRVARNGPTTPKPFGAKHQTCPHSAAHAPWLIEMVVGHSSLQGLRRFVLVTRDAYGFYERCGFRLPARPGRHGVAKARYRRASDAAGRTAPWPRGSIGGDPRGSPWRLRCSRALSERTRLIRSRVVGLPMYIVHGFTGRPFAGNPAAVCFPPAPPSDSWMQQVAAEMRLSETAFVAPAEDGYRLRWFTPTVEVDLCGHATLAAACVQWEAGRLGPGDQARFHTRSGLLTVDQGPMGMTMDFPDRPAEPCREWGDLPAVLGAHARFIGRNGMDGLAELEDEQAVRSLRPDFAL